MSRSVAIAVTALSLAALAFVGVAAARSGGVSSRAVDGYGTISTVPAETEPAGTLATAPQGGELAPLDALDAIPEPDGTADAVEAPAIEVRSGSVASLQAPPPPAPVRLRIGGISVDAPVEPVGFDARRDQMEVPRDREIVGWYRHGPVPGEAGSAVLAAHVDWNGRPGAFFDLVEVAAGTTIVVGYDDGSERRFRAIALSQYGKEELPVDRLFAKDGPAVLTLITCGGRFDSSIRSYRDNIVLQAVEVESPESPDAF